MMSNVAQENTCNRNRGRERPARIDMKISSFPTARPSDIPAVTPTHPASAVAVGEGFPSETLSGNIGSDDNQGAPF